MRFNILKRLKSLDTDNLSSTSFHKIFQNFFQNILKLFLFRDYFHQKIL